MICSKNVNICLGHACANDLSNSGIQLNPVIWKSNINQNSYLWSKKKKSWIKGPEIPTNIKFARACGLPLNSTTILFIGVSSMPFTLTPNDKTITYNFQSRQWKFQEPLSMSNSSNYDYLYECSCSFYETKNDKRYY